MDDKKFEQMMEDWVSKEMASAPDMRPTPDMRQAVASRKRPFAFALFARWATVGVAAAAMILVAVLHPGWFRPQQILEQAERQSSPVEKPAAADALNTPAASAETAKEQAEPAIVAAATIETHIAASEEKMETADNAAGESQLPAPRMMRAEPSAPVAESMSARPPLDATFAPARKAAAAPKICAVPQPSQDEGALTKGISALPGKGKSDLALMTAQEAERLAQCQQIGEKTFLLQHGVWVDSADAPEKARIAIRRDSPAFRDLLALRPDLNIYLEPLPQVVVNLGEVSVEISAQGKTALTDDDLKRLSASVESRQE